MYYHCSCRPIKHNTSPKMTAHYEANLCSSSIIHCYCATKPLHQKRSAKMWPKVQISRFFCLGAIASGCRNQKNSSRKKVLPKTMRHVTSFCTAVSTRLDLGLLKVRPLSHTLSRTTLKTFVYWNAKKTTVQMYLPPFSHKIAIWNWNKMPN